MVKKYLLPIVLILLVSCSDKERKQGLTIAVAANMQFAMEEIAMAFKENTGLSCDLVIGSSGKLTAQIVEGAPFDVLVSADMKYPKSLQERGLAETDPEVYAYGSLVLWTLNDSLDLSLTLLKAEQIRHIALANPKTAPYGVAAEDVLRHYGLYEEVKHKLVFGESIAQTNQFITSGAAEVGFTALSVVLGPQMQVQGRWITPDPASYQPISQGLVVIRKGRGGNTGGIAFRDFLFSARAREILAKFGYTTNE
ncbi:MAG: molybdate ABC transporter substrate-binding protein [Robiginitalea sp.]